MGAFHVFVCVCVCVSVCVRERERESIKKRRGAHSPEVVVSEDVGSELDLLCRFPCDVDVVASDHLDANTCVASHRNRCFFNTDKRRDRETNE